MTLDNPKPGKLGMILMIAGFVVLALSAVAMIFQSRGTLPPGNFGRHLMIVGLGIYIIGRLIYWQKRRAGR
jgi:predicted membrane channel-forming protein YqfA (hemolysin III family)